MVRVMQSALVAEYRRLGRDRSVHQPLAYLRLRSAIRNVIERRAIEPGQALPSERDLAQTLGLSRVTVRKAIAGLVEEGALIQRHGVHGVIHIVDGGVPAWGRAGYPIQR